MKNETKNAARKTRKKTRHEKLGMKKILPKESAPVFGPAEGVLLGPRQVRALVPLVPTASHLVGDLRYIPVGQSGQWRMEGLVGAVKTVEEGGVSGDSGGRGDSGSSEGQWRKEGLGLVIVWLLTIIRRSYKSLLKKKTSPVSTIVVLPVEEVHV